MSGFYIATSSAASGSPSPTRQPTRANPARRTSLSSTTSTDSSADSHDDLPYPLALPRTDFLTANFTPTAYLSTLSTRHQTLEDLRSDLRERSQLLSKELLDLVNANYEDFLNLGLTLRGGEEKVEDVRVGLLGFKRGVGEVRARVSERGAVVEGLLAERQRVLLEVEVGRKLLEVVARVEEMEARLMVGSLAKADGEWSDEEESDEEDGHAHAHALGSAVRKLQDLAKECRRADRLADAVGRDHPFIKGTMQPRMIQVKNTLLLDLGTALKGAYRDGRADGARERLLAVMACFSELGESAEAVRVLKSLKS